MVGENSGKTLINMAFCVLLMRAFVHRNTNETIGEPDTHSRDPRHWFETGCWDLNDTLFATQSIAERSVLSNFLMEATEQLLTYILGQL